MISSIALDWCEKHQNWYVRNCPDCYLDINEESIKREARWKVGEELCSLIGNLMLEDKGKGKLLGDQLQECMVNYFKK